MGYSNDMKKGDLVNFVSAPGMMTIDTSGWQQQSPGLIIGIKDNPGPRPRSYEVLWKNGERTFEWYSYLQVISAC